MKLWVGLFWRHLHVGHSHFMHFLAPQLKSTKPNPKSTNNDSCWTPHLKQWFPYRGKNGLSKNLLDVGSGTGRKVGFLEYEGKGQAVARTFLLTLIHPSLLLPWRDSTRRKRSQPLVRPPCTVVGRPQKITADWNLYRQGNFYELCGAGHSCMQLFGRFA